MNDKQLPSLLSLKLDPPEQMPDVTNAEVVLPQALEQVLALKNQRALELGTEDGSAETQEKEKETTWDKDDNAVSYIKNYYSK